MLKRNLAIVLLGNTAFSGTQYLTAVVIARLGTPQMVGEFALGLAIATPLFAATGLQLRALLATDSTERFSFAQFLLLRVIGSAVALILIAAFSFYSWPVGTALAVSAVGTRAFVDSFSDVYYGKAQQRNRLDIVGWLLCLRGVTGILAIGAVLWFMPRLPLAMMACTVIWAAILFFIERPSVGKAAPDGCKRPAPARDLLRAGIPLAGVLFLLSGSQSVPRLLLQHTAGPAALGVFAAAAMVSAAMGLLFGSVAQTILPLLAEQFVSQRSAYRRTLALALGACALGAGFCIALAVVFGPAIMTAIFGAAYTSGAGILGFLLVGAALSNVAMILGAGATAARQYGPQLVGSALTLIVALTAASIAVPRWGLSGAAVTLVISGITQVAAYATICYSSANSALRAEQEMGQVKVSVPVTAD